MLFWSLPNHCRVHPVKVLALLTGRGGFIVLLERCLVGAGDGARVLEKVHWQPTEISYGSGECRIVSQCDILDALDSRMQGSPNPP